MVPSARIALIAALVVLAADVVVLATGAVSDDSAAPGSSTTTTTALAPGSSVAGAPAGATDTTAVVAGETTTAPPVTEAQTTTTPPPPATTAPPATRTMPAPGTYTMNVTGTESGQFPFTIEQFNATDQRHRSQGEMGDTVQDMRYTPAGVYLTFLDMAGFKQFAPNSPVLFAPAPLTVGAQWEWTMTSTDGRTTIDHSSAVSRAETIAVAGQAVATFVIDTTLRLSGDVTGTVTVTSWASPDYAMAVKTHQVISIRFAALPFNSDTTSELDSLTPA